MSVPRTGSSIIGSRYDPLSPVRLLQFPAHVSSAEKEKTRKITFQSLYVHYLTNGLLILYNLKNYRTAVRIHRVRVFLVVGISLRHFNHLDVIRIFRTGQLPRPIKGRCLPKLRVSLNGYRVCSSLSQS